MGLVAGYVSSAHCAALACGVTVCSAGRAGEDLRVDFAIGFSIADVDLIDLCAELFFGDSSFLAKNLPHRLAQEGQVIELALHGSEFTLCFIRTVLRARSLSAHVIDLRFLADVPDVH